MLVTEWIDGVPPRELPPSRRQELAKRAVRCLAMQLMTEGFIHCDPHEGNLLALPDGTLALLDFGLMAQMRTDHQEAMVRDPWEPATPHASPRRATHAAPGHSLPGHSLRARTCSVGPRRAQHHGRELPRARGHLPWHGGARRLKGRPAPPRAPATAPDLTL